MAGTITVARLVAALRKVPEKKFRIVELAPRLIDKKSRVDVAKCLDLQQEINLALVEVESYIRFTKEAREALQYLGNREEDEA